MPHRLFEWQVRIKAVEREYHVARIALDLLGSASDDDVHELANGRGWNDLAASEIYATENHLDATYLIRMYSVFERAVGSYWRQMPGTQARPDDGNVMIDEVGIARQMDELVIEAAQSIRKHRVNLVHRRIEEHAGVMTIEVARGNLMEFLGLLPARWT